MNIYILQKLIDGEWETQGYITQEQLGLEWIAEDESNRRMQYPIDITELITN